MKEKIVVVVSLLIFLVLGMRSISGAQENKKSAVKERAWFVPPGVTQETNPVKQMEEFLRDMAADESCFQGKPEAMNLLIPGSDSYSKETNVVSTSNITRGSTKMKIVLDHYVATKIENPPGSGKWENGYVVTTFCGKKQVTARQVDTVVKLLIEKAETARDYSYNLLGSSVEKAAKILEEKLGTGDDFAKHLEDKIPGYDITEREYYYLLKSLRASDFVPRELHLGYNAPVFGILGLTYLDTGIVWYNPQAWTADELQGFPKILAHEFVHASPLQRFPLADTFDVELGASWPVALATNEQIDLFFHGYLNPLRKPIKVFFGFNFDQVRKEIIKFPAAGNLFIDEDAWNKHFAELDRIKDALLPFFADVVLPEFLSDPWYWAAVNYEWNDKNAYIYVLMAKYFRPTLLGGSKKTAEWIEANGELLREIGERSAKASHDDSPSDNSPAMISAMHASPLSLSIYKRYFSESERKELEKYFKDHPSELKTLAANPVKFLEAAKNFKEGKLILKGGF